MVEYLKEGTEDAGDDEIFQKTFSILLVVINKMQLISTLKKLKA